MRDIEANQLEILQRELDKKNREISAYQARLANLHENSEQVNCIKLNRRHTSINSIRFFRTMLYIGGITWIIMIIISAIKGGM